MLSRFLELKISLMLFFEADTKFSFSEAEWKTVQDLVPLLLPMYESSVLMSGQDYVTMSSVIPICIDLLEEYSKDDDDGKSDIYYDFKANLYDSLKKRLGKFFLLENNNFSDDFCLSMKQYLTIQKIFLI